MTHPHTASPPLTVRLRRAVVVALACALPIGVIAKDSTSAGAGSGRPSGVARVAQAAPDAGALGRGVLSDGELRGWRQRIGDAIQQKMEPVASVPYDVRVEVDVSVLPNGLAGDIATHRTSGYPALDAAVRRAVLAAQPLPLPSDPQAYAQLRRFSVRYEPRTGFHIADAHPLPDAVPAAPPDATAAAEPFSCRAAGLPAATAPSCQQAGSRTEMLTCFAQAVKARTSEVVGACGVDVYPLEARRLNLEGTTYVGITYDRGGRLSAVAVTESSGQAMLDQRALELIRQSVLPAPPELHAAPFAVRIPVVFRMQRSERPGATPAAAPAGARAEPDAAAPAARSAKPAKPRAASKSKTATKPKASSRSKAAQDKAKKKSKKIKKKKRPLSTQT